MTMQKNIISSNLGKDKQANDRELVNVPVTPAQVDTDVLAA